MVGVLDDVLVVRVLELGELVGRVGVALLPGLAVGRAVGRDRARVRGRVHELRVAVADLQPGGGQHGALAADRVGLVALGVEHGPLGRARADARREVLGRQRPEVVPVVADGDERS